MLCLLKTLSINTRISSPLPIHQRQGAEGRVPRLHLYIAFSRLKSTVTTTVQINPPHQRLHPCSRHCGPKCPRSSTMQPRPPTQGDRGPNVPDQTRCTRHYPTADFFLISARHYLCMRRAAPLQPLRARASGKYARAD